MAALAEVTLIAAAGAPPIGILDAAPAFTDLTSLGAATATVIGVLVLTQVPAPAETVAWPWSVSPS